jgi:hypothetical protein
MSQMGPALCLAVLAELAGLALLRDLFIGISGAKTLLGTSLGDRGSRLILCLCPVTSLLLLIHDTLNWF